MFQHTDVWLNGIALSAVDPTILVQSVQEGAPKIALSTGGPARSDGLRLLYRSRQSLSVSVTFAFREHIDFTRRASAMDAVRSWFRDGQLMLWHRPEQILNVRAADFPELGNPRAWTRSMKMTFTAYEWPFFLDADETVRTLTGSSANGNIFLRGNGPAARASVSVTSESAVTSLTLTAGDTSISLADLNVTAGSEIKIGYDDQMIQYIKAGNVSILQKRTAASADDLLIPCGVSVPLAVSANASVTAVFRARGVWL